MALTGRPVFYNYLSEDSRLRPLLQFTMPDSVETCYVDNNFQEWLVPRILENKISAPWFEFTIKGNLFIRLNYREKLDEALGQLAPMPYKVWKYSTAGFRPGIITLIKQVDLLDLVKGYV